MEVKRPPFQGLMNVVRFNWHFYLIAVGLICILLTSHIYLENTWKLIPYGLSFLISITTISSLLVTYFIYDFSDLYEFRWLDEFSVEDNASILNINAGFDETSQILEGKFKKSEVYVCDFYDQERHTEISIKRARKAYPPHPGSRRVKTSSLPCPDNKFEIVCVTFAAHEIRNFKERQIFFKELRRVTKMNGKIFVTEHLRDIYNFIAYGIGSFHFYSQSSWMNVFQSSNLKLLQERKTTFFVSTFILTPDGTAH